MQKANENYIKALRELKFTENVDNLINSCLQFVSQNNLGINAKDYKNLIEGKFNYFNVGNFINAIAFLNPTQLGIDIKQYAEILNQCEDLKKKYNEVAVPLRAKIDEARRNEIQLETKKAQNINNKKVMSISK